MSDRNTFETYLDHRFQKAGALTPGQKLEVIKQLEEEAQQQGRVPVGEKSVATVPIDHPAVQAVLRGEEVSLGAMTVKNRAGGLNNLPGWAKIGILVGIVVLPLLVGTLFIRSGKAAEATPTPSPTLEPTLPPLPTEPPPTPLPPPTSTPALMLGMGGPAENSRDPASIEIAAQLFIVGRGEVQEDGKWLPQSPEWLSGTEVRRVFAIPYENLAQASVETGDPIYVRTRGGQVLTYLVRDVVRLQANQIETFFSLRPSLLVTLPMVGGDVNSVERVVIFGEAQIEEVLMEVVPETRSPSNPSANSTAPNSHTFGGTNLRDNPGLKSNVMIGMPANTPLYLSDSPPVTIDDVTWVYVLSPYGYGWVAKQMIAMP